MLEEWQLLPVATKCADNSTHFAPSPRRECQWARGQASDRCSAL